MARAKMVNGFRIEVVIRFRSRGTRALAVSANCAKIPHQRVADAVAFRAVQVIPPGMGGAQCGEKIRFSGTGNGTHRLAAILI